MKTLLLILFCFCGQLLCAQPKITSFSPVSGPVGTTVTITGTGFSTNPTNNIVFFGAVRGTVTAASATSISVTVPAGASYKFITVTTAGLMANSKKPFIVTFPGGGAISANSFAPPVNFSNSNLSGTSYLALKDFDNDGKADIATSTVLIYKNNSTPGSPALAAPVDVNNNNGAGLGYVQSEDLDGDGKPDIVATDKIIQNTSTGGTLSFAAPANLHLGEQTAIIDFDGDGLPDLARGFSSPADLYRNTSFGGVISFQPPSYTPSGSSTSTGVVAAYLNSDDKPDFVSSAKPDYFIRTSINNSTPGNFSFTAGPNLLVSLDATNGVQSITVGDFDGDDKPDVAASWRKPATGEGFISIFRNTSANGSTSFADRIDYSIGNTYPGTIVTSDIDGDGKIDIAVLLTDSVAIFRNICSIGTISFEPKINLAAPAQKALEIADVDGDGKPDICVGGYPLASISILRNTIETPNVTSFSPSEACTGTTITITGTNLTGATAVSIGGVAVTSFTVLSNTTIDAVLGTGASGIVSVTTPLGTATKDGFTYTGACNLTPKITSFTPSSAPAGTSVTIKGQKFSTTASDNTVYFGAVKAAISSATDTSLIVTVPTGATNSPITVTVNNLTGYSSTSFTLTFTSATNNPLTVNSFAAKQDFATGNSPFSAVISDIDDNNQADIITANFSSNSISSLRNISASPSIAFAAPSDSATGSQPIGIAYGDLDGDGKSDVATVNNSSNSVSVFLNTSSTGMASYATKIDFATGTGPRGIYIRDVDLDGKADLIITNFSDNTVSVLRNTSSGSGSASFAAQVTFATGTGPYGIFVQDVDADNIPDIEVVNSQSGTISVLRNISSGSGNIGFSAKTDFITGSQPAGIFVNDLDSDGKPDIAVSNSSSATISVFKNSSSTGSISFDPKVDYAAGLGPFSIAVADLNGDGKADIATANAYDNTVSVLRNTGTAGTMAFDTKVDYPIGNNPRSISIGDIDGDGKADIVSANYNDNTISVLSNMVSSVLPITFQYVNARWSGNDGLLTWTTQSEENVKSFIVERSTDGVNYKTAGSVAATGNSNTLQQYHFADVGAKALSSKSLYYRIKMVNSDGTFTYSSVAILNVDGNSINIITAAPSPFTDNFTLKINSAKRVNTFIIVTDATGKVVLRQNALLLEGINNINVKGSNFSKGIYNVQVLTDSLTATFRILKQ